jgi:1,2-diacylglycerol 3-beta-glucosyltransferase
MSAFTPAGAAFAVLGGVPALFAAYQVAIALAANLYRPPRPSGRPTRRIVVLVPAHDEAALVARCVDSLLGQRYPADLREVVVIADNCTDDTAAIARSAGAEVLVRDRPDERGKGRALRWAIDQLVSRSPAPDGIAVVDADSVADPDFLEALAEPFERGAGAVQGESLLTEDGSPASALRAAAFLLVNRVKPAGRAVLGLPCHLRGNGMLFRTDVLRANPWNAFSSAEDLEYSIRLRLAGVRPQFAGGAVVRSGTAPTAEAAVHQQLRWEGGKLHVARTLIPRLVAAALRRRDFSLLDAAFELALPPIGLLFAGACLGAAVGTAAVSADLLPGWSLVPWLVAVVGVPAYVLVGLRAGRAPGSAYRALLHAPAFVARKGARAHRLLTFRADTWVRTARGRESD